MKPLQVVKSNRYQLGSNRCTGYGGLQQEEISELKQFVSSELMISLTSVKLPLLWGYIVIRLCRTWSVKPERPFKSRQNYFNRRSPPVSSAVSKYCCYCAEPSLFWQQII